MNLKYKGEPRQDGSALTDEDINELKTALKGTLIVKGTAGAEEYEKAIKRWNEIYIKAARLVAFVEDERDVVTCVRFVDKHHLDVAVAGGRHSYHGASSTDGLIIDLGRLRKVSVDKEAQTATAQGGCLAADVEQAAEAEGLSVVFGQVNETGIGGLTLGGGIGWLTGQYGLTIDNLLAVRMVLANGEVVDVSDDENPDLFWAIRGAGANFGIVLEFKYRAHSQGPVWTQIAGFTPDKIPACIGLVNKLRTEVVEPQEGKLQIMLALARPPGVPVLCPLFMMFYDGPEEKARELTKPVFDLGPANTFGGVTPYAATTVPPEFTRMDGFQRYGASSAHLQYPIDEKLLIDIFDRFKTVSDKYHETARPSILMLDFRDYRKLASVPSSATAYASRYNTAMIFPDFRWDDPALDATMRREASAITAFVRERVMAAKVSAHVQDDGQTDITALYPNVSGGTEKTKSVYGSNLPRLQQLKKRYDPDFMFNKWFPIA